MWVWRTRGGPEEDARCGPGGLGEDKNRLLMVGLEYKGLQEEDGGAYVQGGYKKRMLGVGLED